MGKGKGVQSGGSDAVAVVTPTKLQVPDADVSVPGQKPKALDDRANNFEREPEEGKVSEQVDSVALVAQYPTNNSSINGYLSLRKPCHRHCRMAPLV